MTKRGRGAERGGKEGHKMAGGIKKNKKKV